MSTNAVVADEKITVTEAARRLNRSETTVRNYIATGAIRGVKITGRTYVFADDIAQLLVPVPVQPTAAAV